LNSGRRRRMGKLRRKTVKKEEELVFRALPSIVLDC